VPVRRIAATVDDFALFGNRRLLTQIILTVQLCEILCDNDAFRVGPWALSDAVARANSRLSVRRLRAEICVPSVTTCSGGLGELLAMLISSVQPAEITSLAGYNAGDNERHRGLLRISAST
jgi:hypothetical protein